MALTAKQKEEIVALLKVGELSNRAIAKEIGCSESIVRTIAKKQEIERGKIAQLVDEEITNTIMQEKIVQEKSALNSTEKRMYDKLYLDKTNTLNMFNDSTITNQELLNMAQEGVLEAVSDSNGNVDKVHLATQLPNLLAIGKGTETNRKQLFGTTEAYKPKEEAEEVEDMVIHIIEDKGE
jgi:hypothetical protein